MGVNGTNMTQEQWDSNVASIRKGMQTATPTTGIPAGVDPAYHASVVQSYNDSLLRRPADQASANTAIAQEKSANPAAWGIPPTITAKPPTQMSSTNNMPTAQPMSAQQSAPPDYAALASARFAAGLANKRTIAQQQKSSADTAYQQQTLRTNDNRTLQDFSRTQTANPFGNMGRKSFNEGLIGRERTQADADSAASLASQKSNIDQLLASYESATADEQVRIADELQRADRQYQLELSNQSGIMANGQKTLAGSAQDFNQGMANKQFGQQQQVIDYNQNPLNPQNQGQVLNNAGQALSNKLNELKIGNYPTEVKQQAQLFEQQVAAGKMSNEAAEYNLSQLKDPNSASNRAKELELQMKQLEADNLPEQQRLQLQQLRKQIAEIGVVHYKPQTANEIEMDKVHLETAQEQLKQLKSPEAPKGQTAEGYASYVDGVAKYDNGSNSDNGAKQLTNPVDVEKSILQSGLSESEMRKLYTRFGLNWGE